MTDKTKTTRELALEAIKIAVNTIKYLTDIAGKENVSNAVALGEVRNPSEVISLIEALSQEQPEPIERVPHDILHTLKNLKIAISMGNLSRASAFIQINYAIEQHEKQFHNLTKVK